MAARLMQPRPIRSKACGGASQPHVTHIQPSQPFQAGHASDRCAVVEMQHALAVCCEVWPHRHAIAVGITGLRDVRPVCCHQIGEGAIRVAPRPRLLAQMVEHRIAERSPSGPDGDDPKADVVAPALGLKPQAEGRPAGPTLVGPAPAAAHARAAEILTGDRGRWR